MVNLIEKIVLNVSGHRIEMTLQEVVQLRDELNKNFPEAMRDVHRTEDLCVCPPCSEISEIISYEAVE